MVAHLLAVPAGAHAEVQATAREVVDARDLLGGDDRVALDHQADAAGDPQRGGGGGGRRQRHEQVVGVGVDARQLPARRVGGLAAGGNVGVLREEQRAMPAFLDEPGEGGRVDAVVGGEVADAEIHRGATLPPRRVLGAGRRGYVWQRGRSVHRQRVRRPWPSAAPAADDDDRLRGRAAERGRRSASTSR